jgi:flavin reductase
MGEVAFTTTDFRRVMGQFLSGVTIVGVLEPADGPNPARVHGMTANAFMSVSLDPALIVVSVGGATHTHSVLEQCTSFGVSILRQGQERIALQFAGKPGVEEAVEFDHDSDGPVLRDCLTSVCAALVTSVRAGDHTLFIGEVTKIFPGRSESRPLAYHHGQFVLTGERTGDWPVDLWDAWVGALHSRWG